MSQNCLDSAFYLWLLGATGSGSRLDQVANFSFDGTRRKEMMHVLDLVKVSRGRKSCFSSDSMWHEHTIVSLIVSASLSGSATHSTTFKSFGESDHFEGMTSPPKGVLLFG